MDSGGGAVKNKPDVTVDMANFLLDQGKALDLFYVDSKKKQGDMWRSVNTGEKYQEEEQDPRLQTLEDQLEERHYEEDSTNMLQSEKGNGGMYMKNGEGTYQYNSGKGMPSIFYDNLPANQTWV